MRNLVAIAVWVGVFGVVREWRHARKHGIVITLWEKLYLLAIFPATIIALPLLLELAGFEFQVFMMISLIALAVAVSAWPIKRRIQRTNISQTK